MSKWKVTLHYVNDEGLATDVGLENNWDDDDAPEAWCLASTLANALCLLARAGQLPTDQGQDAVQAFGCTMDAEWDWPTNEEVENQETNSDNGPEVG